VAIIRQAEERKVPVWRITMLQVSAIAGFLLLAGTFWFFQVIQHEQFRGVLVPFMGRSLDRRTLPAFEQMNQALKRRAEQPRP